MEIKLEGWEEFEQTIQQMNVDDKDIKKALSTGIKTIANEIEKKSPKRTGKLGNIKTQIKTTIYGGSATAKAGAFYDVFQEYGTSQQKAHVGYFSNAVEESENKAIEEISNILLKD